MPEYNRDIQPTQETQDLYAEIGPLIKNELLEQAFSKRERDAAAAKRQYHRLGRIAILLIAASAIYTVAEGLVLDGANLPHEIALVAAGLAVAGVLLQLYLLVSGRKQVWLLNRYAAERLRSIKFQAFPLAAIASDTTELGGLANAYYTEAITRLNNEVANGAIAITQFSPTRALGLAQDDDGPNAALTAQANKAYLDLRTEFQRKFAGGERVRLDDRARWSHSSSDVLYLLAALFVAVALALKVVPVTQSFWGHWADFVAVVLFIVSLSVAVLENAAIDEESRSRYAAYEEELTALIDEARLSDLPLATLVRRTELLALRELADFCRSAQRITYRV